MADDRALLGDLARVAARTVTAAVRALTGEPQLAVGIVGRIQTHGSLANWHPRIHMIATDGGFRPDGTFVPWPAHDTARLTEAFRRAVLRLFVRRWLFERDDAQAMLAWPHSGFHVHDAVLVPDGDMAFALRLARYCARNPVALERLEYDGVARQVRYRSDKSDEPTAGTETVDPLEFLAGLTAHIPNKGQVMTRYYGYYANRVRGARRRREQPADEPPPVAEPVPLALREAHRRWAELLRQIFEVDPLRCPACGSEMSIVAFITQRGNPPEMFPLLTLRLYPAGTRGLRGCGDDTLRDTRCAPSHTPRAPDRLHATAPGPRAPRSRRSCGHPAARSRRPLWGHAD